MSSQICKCRCRGWETDLIANDYSWQLVKGLSVWIMSSFPWSYCFFRNHTHMPQLHIVLWLGSLPGKRGATSTGQEWISQFPKRSWYMNTLRIHSFKMGFFVATQTHDNKVSSPYFHVFWPCTQCSMIQPSHTHTQYLTAISHKQCSNKWMPRMYVLPNKLKLDTIFDCIHFWHSLSDICYFTVGWVHIFQERVT